MGSSIVLILALPELIATAAEWLFSDSLEWFVDFFTNFDSFLAQELPRFSNILDYVLESLA